MDGKGLHSLKCMSGVYTTTGTFRNSPIQARKTTSSSFQCSNSPTHTFFHTHFLDPPITYPSNLPMALDKIGQPQHVDVGILCWYSYAEHKRRLSESSSDQY